MIDRLLQLCLDLRIGLAAHRHDGALARADDAGDDRHVVADHLVEVERRLCLVDESRDVADVDRLVQVYELAALPQPFQELAESLVHHSMPPVIETCGCRHSSSAAAEESDRSTKSKGRAVVY